MKYNYDRSIFSALPIAAGSLLNVTNMKALLSPILILMFSDFTWRRIGREKFFLSLNIIAQTLELELDLVYSCMLAFKQLRFFSLKLEPVFLDFKSQDFIRK